MSGHVLIAPDKFKGSLSASQVADHLRAGLARAAPGREVRAVPVADGGEGTLDAARAAGFTVVDVPVTGPTGAPVVSAYAARDGVAIVELADASGLARLPGEVRAPLRASSFGTGELLRAALDAGCRRVVLGLGGSAGTDGGAGMLQALGVHLRDHGEQDIPPGGAGLAGLTAADAAGLHPAVGEAEIVVATDVDNPLCGEYGAATVYGEQKGADTAQIRELEAGLARLARVCARDLGADPALASAPGAGAAGGVGYAAIAALGARRRPGIDYLLELLGFPKQLPGAAVVITGEGSLDRQTLRGKAPAGVLAAAGEVPVLAVAGRCTLEPAELAAAGFAGLATLSELEPDQQRCIDHAGELLERLAAERIAGELDRLGRSRGR